MEAGNSRTFNGRSTAVSRLLARSPLWCFVLFVGIAGFMTYFAMYAFRKPFTANVYGDMVFGMNAKTVFVISQLIGYVLSKYAGIWVCSSVPPRRRIHFLLGLILFAELTLVAVAILPLHLKPLAFFLNGLPLGMVWGGVVLFLEGRRSSDILLSMLLASYIFASAVVKDTGRFLLDFFHTPIYWMPMATGLVFLPLFLLGIWMLAQVPVPDRHDNDVRFARTPMTARQRIDFLRDFGVGFVLLITFYFFATGFRNIRDDFGAEIFMELGLIEVGGIFSRVDIYTGLGMFVVLSLLYFLPSKRWGAMPNLVLLLFGTLLLGGATVAFDLRWISGMNWMILLGMAAYLMYLPADTLFYDRLIVRYQIKGTAVFMSYVMDSIGYTGTVCIYLYREFFIEGGVDILPFFRGLCYGMTIGGGCLIVFATIFFRNKARRTDFTEKHPTKERLSTREAKPWHRQTTSTFTVEK